MTASLADLIRTPRRPPQPLLGPDHPVVAGRTSDAVLLRAARGEAVEHTPVWFMRQAGRSLPEYRRVREGTAMLESCFTPELVVEITDQPVRRHGVDAAIFFSDIVVPLKAIGVDLDIVPGVGPVVADPIRDAGRGGHAARPHRRGRRSRARGRADPRRADRTAGRHAR